MYMAKINGLSDWYLTSVWPLTLKATAMDALAVKVNLKVTAVTALHLRGLHGRAVWA